MIDTLAKLRAGASGICISRQLAEEMDAFLVAQFHAAQRPAGARAALVAIGGLGRHERSPKSDVDLLILHDGRADMKAFSDRILYPLWDAKLDVGHGVRTVGETIALFARDDATLTSHLDARLLAGDPELFSALQEASTKAFRAIGADYVQRLLEPIRERARAESLVFVLEPNLKTGPGGLRDIHQIGWVQRLTGAPLLTAREQTQLIAARSFYLRVRAFLHVLANHRQDHVSFERQPELAAELHVDVERLLGRHYRHAQQVIDIKHRMFLRVDEDRAPRPRLKVADTFAANPAQMLRLFATSLEQNLPVDDATLDAVIHAAPAIDDRMRAEPACADAFWQVIDHPQGDRALVDMHYASVLGRYLPEFGRTQGMVQADFYHSHTVDVHTLRVLELLYACRRDGGEFSCVEEPSWRSLVMGCMFHDAGKRSGRDHAVYGAELVESAMIRLGAPLADIEDAQLLVREHLTMPKISQRRDLSDPELIASFARTVGSEARLRRLYVLSYVDTAGTGPHLWTPWKAALLKELYERTLAYLRAQPLPEPPRPQLKEGVWLEGEAHGHRPLWVVTPDRPGLLALVAGLCAARRVSIAWADVFSSTAGVAMDRFMLRYDAPAALAPEERASQAAARYASVVDDITSALANKRAVETLPLPRAHRHLGPRPPSRVHIGEASALGHVLEVSAPDRPGLLFDLARTLYELGFSIHSARIVTEGARAIDVFYVTPAPTQSLVDRLIALLA